MGIKEDIQILRESVYEEDPYIPFQFFAVELEPSIRPWERWLLYGGFIAGGVVVVALVVMVVAASL